MATIDLATKFGKQGIKVERLLQELGVTSSAGRTIFILTMANAEKGVRQKKVVESLALRKDVVTTIVQSLTRAGLLVQERDVSDARCWQLLTTDSGRELLSSVKGVLRTRRGDDSTGKSRQRDEDWLW